MNRVTHNTLTTKRDDPQYAQVSGYVPKKLALKFKVACTQAELSQSDALERALELWLADINSETHDRE